jgi:quinol monooxygenase YgiN
LYAHRDEGKRFIVRADRELTAFIELESGDSRLTRDGGGHIALLRNRPTIEKFQLRRSIMFAVIRHYHFNPKDSAEIDRRIREDFVPMVKKAKGFVRYYWLDTGEGEGASVSVFKDKAGADESVRLAADYIQKHLSKLITQKPEIIEGPIKAHD